MLDYWATFKDSVYSGSTELLSPTTRKNQNRFDENEEEIKVILQEKYRLHRAYQNDPFFTTKKTAFANVCGIVQPKLRKMQGSWFRGKTDEIQSYTDRYDSKRFFDALKALHGLQSTGISSLLSADWTIVITEKDGILDRWTEHFESALKRQSIINNEIIDHLYQVDINHEMDSPPQEDEVKEAIGQLSNGKAPGADALWAEVYKTGSPPIISQLTKLFQSFWEKGQILHELKDTSVIHLYKRIGNCQACDNQSGISLAPYTWEVLARIMLDWLNAHLEEGHLPQSQCSFSQGRGAVDMIFAACQFQENARIRTNSYTQHSLSIPRPSTQQIRRDYGRLWWILVARQIHHHGQVVSWQNDSLSTHWWWFLWCLSSLKWDQTSVYWHPPSSVRCFLPC